MIFKQTDLIQSVLVGRLAIEVILRTEIFSTGYTLMHQKIWNEERIAVVCSWCIVQKRCQEFRC